MSTLRAVDLPVIDQLFQADPGYVLDFTNRTLSEFFLRELDVDIDDPRYAARGSSKLNRLKCHLLTVDNESTAAALKALWEYRSILRSQCGLEATESGDEPLLRKLVTRLTGSSDLSPTGELPAPAFDRQMGQRFRDQLNALWDRTPHQRGYGFETFLRDLFAASGLKPRDGFTLRGEQIDGSFELGREIYLLEAKWHQDPLGAAELRIFQSKVEEKAVWTRGLFVSFSGFTQQGLDAFGRRKSIICMSGKDIYDALGRDIHFAEVLDHKVRHAAETGAPFAPLDSLFPE